jgi:ribosome maturation factor RimP
MRENSRRGAASPARPGRRTRPGRGPSQAQPGRPAGAPGTAETAWLAGLIDPVVSAMGMDVEGVKIASAGRRRMLKIVVDADGGVGLDQIADVSREISARLDAQDAMGDAPYTLEVSSPGIDRPLTEPRHWRRAAGRLVDVPLTAEGPASQQARIVGADDASVTLEIEGIRRTFGYGELGAGRVRVEFGRLDEADEADEADEEDRNGY